MRQYARDEYRPTFCGRRSKVSSAHALLRAIRFIWTACLFAFAINWPLENFKVAPPQRMLFFFYFISRAPVKVIQLYTTNFANDTVNSSLFGRRVSSIPVCLCKLLGEIDKR